MKRRPQRNGFATIEIFVVSLVFLLLGLVLTFGIRWLFDASHWLTFGPLVLLSIPFVFSYGVLLPMIVFGLTREWWRGRAD